MSKTIINIQTLNLSVAPGASRSGLEHLLLAAVMKADDVSCSHATVDAGTVDATGAEAVQRTSSGNAVMVAFRTGASSSGFELNDTRKNGGKVPLSRADGDFVVVEADSALGAKIQAAGSVFSDGYVNFYNNTGNFGKTIHSTAAKAEYYGDGNFTTIKVFIADVRDALAASVA